MQTLPFVLFDTVGRSPERRYAAGCYDPGFLILV
jgi:hypothetical protein